MMFQQQAGGGGGGGGEHHDQQAVAEASPVPSFFFPDDLEPHLHHHHRQQQVPLTLRQLLLSGGLAGRDDGGCRAPLSCATSSYLGSRGMLGCSTPGAGDSSSECNSTASSKKARVHDQAAASSAQSTMKVRKERLGDRITALHQIVSPFGKTDTVSVLQETVGYIRFLLGQIEALSYPYLGQGNIKHINSMLQLQVSEVEEEEDEEHRKDLRFRGLCLAPISCTMLYLSGGVSIDEY